MTPEPTLALANHVHKISYDDLPQKAIDNAKLAILDTIGVMFAVRSTKSRALSLITCAPHARQGREHSCDGYSDNA